MLAERGGWEARQPWAALREEMWGRFWRTEGYVADGAVLSRRRVHALPGYSACVLACVPRLQGRCARSRPATQTASTLSCPAHTLRRHARGSLRHHLGDESCRQLCVDLNWSGRPVSSRVAACRHRALRRSLDRRLVACACIEPTLPWPQSW